MTPSRKQVDLAGFDLVMRRELYSLLIEKCRSDGIPRAVFVRKLLAKALGNPQLAEMPRGIGEKVVSRKARNGHS